MFISSSFLNLRLTQIFFLLLHLHLLVLVLVLLFSQPSLDLLFLHPEEQDWQHIVCGLWSSEGGGGGRRGEEEELRSGGGRGEETKAYTGAVRP